MKCFMILGAALALAACGSAPKVDELPPEPVVTPTTTQPSDPPPLQPVQAEWLQLEEIDALTVEELEIEDVRGGRIRAVLPGSPEQVLAALLDFDASAPHRSWAEGMKSLPAEAGRARAEWQFEGKAGINPTTILSFETIANGDGLILRYRLEKKAFGLAAFFGDYRLTPLAGTPPRTQFEERVFIDSGLWIANASKKDIEEGLREDLRLLLPWLEERLGLENRSRAQAPRAKSAQVPRRPVELRSSQ